MKRNNQTEAKASNSDHNGLIFNVISNNEMTRKSWFFALLIVTLTPVHVRGQIPFPEAPGEEATNHLSARPFLEPIPATPDYGQMESWACLPGGFLDSQECELSLPFPRGIRARSLPAPLTTCEVDIFYIHPTMYLEGEGWNADVADVAMNHEVDKWPLRHQASAFAGVGRVFAPRYRQAHIRIFDLGDSLSWAAANVAYADVKSAFQHYMKHWNEGRPLIIAGHSQGSFHGRTLLQEYFDGTELQERLVAAYLPGMDMYDDEFKEIELCNRPNQTGCLCTWMTYGEGFTPTWLAKQMQSNPNRTPMCVHPVSWTIGQEAHGKKEHLGVVRPSFRLSRPHAITAEIQPNGVLWIQPPHVLGGRLLQRDNWHSGDINLFWVNVYENAQKRTMNWQSSQDRIDP